MDRSTAANNTDILQKPFPYPVAPAVDPGDFNSVLCRVVNEVLWDEFGSINCCVLAAATTITAMRMLGTMIDGVPIRIEAAVLNEKVRPMTTLGMVSQIGRKAAPDMWTGHLAVVADGHILLDPTLDQVNAYHSEFEASPLAIDVGPGFLERETTLCAPTGPSGSWVRITSLPHVKGYLSAPDWRRKGSRGYYATKVVERLDVVFPHDCGPTCPCHDEVD